MADSPGKLTPTKTARIAGDLADKLDDLLDVLRMSSAEYLDSLIRTQVESDHKAHQSAIAVLRKARERNRKARDEGPVMSNELGEGN